MSADFIAADEGSAVGVAALSDAGREWWRANVPTPEPWQQMGAFVWCDRRNGLAIIAGIESDGLSVERWR